MPFPRYYTLHLQSVWYPSYQGAFRRGEVMIPEMIGDLRERVRWTATDVTLIQTVIFESSWFEE